MMSHWIVGSVMCGVSFENFCSKVYSIEFLEFWCYRGKVFSLIRDSTFTNFVSENSDVLASR